MENQIAKTREALKEAESKLNTLFEEKGYLMSSDVRSALNLDTYSLLDVDVPIDILFPGNSVM